jgi:hypothetical protein
VCVAVAPVVQERLAACEARGLDQARAVPSETTQEKEKDFSRRSNVCADSYLCPGAW